MSATAASAPLNKLARESDKVTASSQSAAGVNAVPAKAIQPDAMDAVKKSDVAPSSDGQGAVAAPEDRAQQIRLQDATYVAPNGETVVRPLEELVDIYAGGAGVFFLTDEEIVTLSQNGKIAAYALEKVLQDHERAVRVRRALVSRASHTKTLESSLLPHRDYDYAKVMGACCENVVGYMPIPVGIAGPLNIDGQVMPIPMATTEGTLVASTSRGCKALNAGGGVTTVLTQDAMTRGPALEFPSVVQAAKAKRWIDSQDGASTIKAAFDSTSRFARLSSLRCVLAGRTLPPDPGAHEAQPIRALDAGHHDAAPATRDAQALCGLDDATRGASRGAIESRLAHGQPLHLNDQPRHPRIRQHRPRGVALVEPMIVFVSPGDKVTRA
ncbi:hypothetical protein L1887_59940 [Cichorium endivia]|nr:hypothetical protein L1887_59940 [Cichorium endivia]